VRNLCWCKIQKNKGIEGSDWCFFLREYNRTQLRRVDGVFGLDGRVASLGDRTVESNFLGEYNRTQLCRVDGVYGQDCMVASLGDHRVLNKVFQHKKKPPFGGFFPVN
jgi:hypothetical protein